MRNTQNLLPELPTSKAEILGWDDIIGDVIPKTLGVGSPQLVTFIDDVRWFSYAAGEDGDIVFHLPHTYARGTDLFIHVHWAHNGTNISGTFDLRTHLTYARGHNQPAHGNFHSDVENHIVVSNLSLAAMPQYRHRIDEIKISTPGGAATLLDTNILEPDGLILCHYDVDVIPNITGGSGEPFIFCLDIHHQVDRIGTLNKSPDFYR